MMIGQGIRRIRMYTRMHARQIVAAAVGGLYKLDYGTQILTELLTVVVVVPENAEDCSSGVAGI